MMKKYYAQVIDNIVYNVIEGEPEGRFDPSIKWHPCSVETKIGDLYHMDSQSSESPMKDLEDEKRVLLDILEKHYEAIIRKLLSGYSFYEMITWDVQYEEAKFVLAGNPPEDALFLSNMCKERHIDVVNQAKRVVKNNIGFRYIAGTATGKRLYFEDLVKGCKTEEQLDHVKNKINQWLREGAY